MPKPAQVLSTEVLATVSRQLFVPLTDDELRERGCTIATLTVQIEAAESAKKEAAADAKAHIDVLDIERSQLARTVADREERRTVECSVEIDWARNVVRVVRLDTGAVVEERAPTADEQDARQRRLA